MSRNVAVLVVTDLVSDNDLILVVSGNAHGESDRLQGGHRDKPQSSEWNGLINDIHNFNTLGKKEIAVKS